MNQVRNREIDGSKFNKNLDPIKFLYDHFDPCLRAVHRAEFDDWQLFLPQPRIIENITKLYLEDNDTPLKSYRDREKRLDFYLFFGKTGITKDESGNNSYMGFVIHEQTNPDDPGVVRIVFRGSRSGYAERNIVEGNKSPDWETDLQIKLKSHEPDICAIPFSMVPTGFAKSLISCWPSLYSVLRKIHERNNSMPPDAITIAGHSLGGALGLQFACAMTSGNMLDNDGAVSTWGWDWHNKMSVYTYGAPPAGNIHFKNACNAKFHTERIWVSNDPIVIGAGKYYRYLDHVGTETMLEDSGGLMLPHNLQIIRWRLLEHLKKYNDDQLVQNTPDYALLGSEPSSSKDKIKKLSFSNGYWQKFISLEEVTKVLINHGWDFYLGRDDLRIEATNYLDCLIETLKQTGSYHNILMSEEDRSARARHIDDFSIDLVEHKDFIPTYPFSKDNRIATNFIEILLKDIKFFYEKFVEPRAN